ncbi:MAG: hypothetical protein IPK12_01260 [Gemmatimonadetes bacterium]|nr:hypothetical protein [Gemmatimonadota bacterium]
MLDWLTALRVRAGESLAVVRKELGTTSAVLKAAAEAGDVVAHLLGFDLGSLPDGDLQRAARNLGQLLLGRAAETVFEEAFGKALGSHGYSVEDYRTDRSGTDFRVRDSLSRPLYRLNIKFHGSQFSRAPDLVGLQSVDCFALATYKIKGALDKQQDEHLPYVFVIVGVPHLTGAAVGAKVPTDLVELAAVVSAAPRINRKRDFEDRVVDWISHHGLPVYSDTISQIASAPWYVLSARRADQVLRAKLYERVFALRVRNFAQQFRSAEVDMHFSLSQDLTPLHDFFTRLRDDQAGACLEFS